MCLILISETSLHLADVEMSKAALISIVDDDAPARDGIGELVESLGYKGAAFKSGEHFLESGLIVETTCLITDLQMPGLNGLDDLVFGVENFLHRFFGAFAQALAVALQHLERLVAALGDAGD